MNFINALRLAHAVGNEQTRNIIRSGAQIVSNLRTGPGTEENKVEKVTNAKLSSSKKLDTNTMVAAYAEASLGNYVVHMPSLTIVFRTNSPGEAVNVAKKLDVVYSVETGTLTDKALIRLSSVATQCSSWTPFQVSCALGSPKLVSSLLSSSKDTLVLVNDATTDGVFPLQLACEAECLDVVQMLVKCNADIHKIDAQGRTAVHVAAASSPQLLKALSAHRAFARTLYMVDESGRTPIQHAIVNGHRDSVKILAACYNPTETTDQKCPPVLLCILDKQFSFTEQSKLVLHELLSIRPMVIHQKDERGKTILHHDVPIQVLRYLLSFMKGLELDKLDNQGATPLHYAITSNRLSSAAALIAYGSDVNKSNGTGMSPFHLAVQAGSIELVKLLLLFGSNIGAESPATLLNGLPYTSLRSGDFRNKLIVILGVHFNLPEYVAKREKPMLNGLHQKIREECLNTVRSSAQKGKLLLSLDGGGIRGLVLIQMLIELQRRCDAPIMDYCEWVAGTSTGAILALALSAGKSLDYCQRLYFRFKDEVFQGKRPYAENCLEDLLKAEFGPNSKMDSLRKRVLVTTAVANQKPARLQLFRSYMPPLPKDELQEQGFIDPSMVTLWQAARCSSAAPTYFNSYQGKYMDGGVIANNPCCEALCELQYWNQANRLANKSGDITPVCVVLSLGTGIPPVVQTSASVDINLSGFTGILNSVNAAMHLKDVFIEQLSSADGVPVDRACGWSHSMNVPFFRLSPSLMANVELDDTDDERLINMMWATKEHIAKQPDVDVLVSFLNQSIFS